MIIWTQGTFITCAESTGLGPRLVGNLAPNTGVSQVGRVLLTIGAVAGGLIFAVGVLGLIITITAPGANPASEYRGAFGLMAVGAIVAAPCTFFVRRIRDRSSPPWSPIGSSTVPATGDDLRQSYLAWFAWCQQALGGDAVSLHATTMAALACGT